MEFWIVVDKSQMSLQLIKKELSITLNGRQDVELKLKKSKTTFRGIDPTVLVAIVATTGTAIGALIGGLFKILGQNSANRIVLQGKEGWRIEIPANISSEKLEEVITRLQELDQGKVKLTIE